MLLGLELGILLPDYLSNRLCHRFKDLNDRTNEGDVGGKVVVITGANSGIGKVLTIQMIKRGAKVVMACRDMIKARALVNEILNWSPQAELVLVKLDLTDLESVRDCAEKIKSRFPYINLLINNAGYMSSANRIERTINGFEQHLAANCLGHFVLTHLLLDHLKKGAPSRIVSTGSMMYKFGDYTMSNINYPKEDVYLGPNNYGPYCNSKLLVMLLSKELGRRLQGTQVTTYSLCPGMVATDLLRNSYSISYFFSKLGTDIFGMSVNQGAETPMYCALNIECEQETGRVYHFAKLWKKTNDFFTDEMAAEAYTKILSLIKVHAERNKKHWLTHIYSPALPGHTL